MGQQSDKNAAEAGAGLLQLAMQDAGITPSSSNSNSTQPEESLTTTSGQRSSANDQSMLGSALHTLASVASNTQNVTNVSQIPASQVQSNASLIQTGTTTTTTQSVNSMAPIMATGQQNMNGTMNMSFGQQQMATNMMQGNQVMNSGTPNAMQQICSSMSRVFRVSQTFQWGSIPLPSDFQIWGSRLWAWIKVGIC